jgi:ligand-binding sensor domain-containing protein
MGPWRAALAVCAAAILLFAGSAIWQASRTLSLTQSEVKNSATIRFTRGNVELAPAAGFEILETPASFSDAIAFNGHLAVSGSAGLFEYDADGTLLRSFRAGLELPAAPIAAMATGALAGGAGQELLLATGGEGLLAYDGHRIRQIRAESESRRTLTCLLPLPNGSVLMGTAKDGVLVYDGNAIAAFHPSLSALQVTALAGDATNLWVGTIDQGVLYFHAGELARFSEAEGVPDPHILSLAVAGDRAYVGTSMGAAEFERGKFRRVLAPDVMVRSLLLRQSTLLAGTMEDGVVEVALDARRPRGARAATSALSGEIVKLREHGEATLALTSDALYLLKPGHATPVNILRTSQPLLADSNISSLAVEPGGTLWVGYFDRGLDIIPANGSRKSHVENEHVFCVNRILHDAANNRTAVATANGLVMFDAAGVERQVLTRAEGLIANHVTDIALRPNGLAAATPAGITLLDGGAPRSLYAFHGLVNNHVYALGADGNRLLVGTLGGLSILENDSVRARYTTANSALRQNWITSIVKAGGDWYIGTYGEGVLVLDRENQWRTFTDQARGLIVNPNAMLATTRAVYAGTLGHGLARYSLATGRWRTITAGLPSTNVTALALHGDTLYIGTGNGLVRVPETNLGVE